MGAARTKGTSVGRSIVLIQSCARDRARGAYSAICLDLAQTCREEAAAQGKTALEALRQLDQISQVLFYHSPVPAAAPLQEKAIRALERPSEQRRPW